MDEGARMLAPEALAAIVGDPKASTTAAGSNNRLRHWGYYIAAFHEGCDPGALAPSTVYWPPSMEEWVEFLNELRPRLKSHPAFKNAVENICSVGRQLVGGGNKHSDPRRLFSFAHKRAMTALLRHHGQENTFVAALDMFEARNGPFFVDRGWLGLQREGCTPWARCLGAGHAPSWRCDCVMSI